MPLSLNGSTGVESVHTFSSGVFCCFHVLTPSEWSRISQHLRVQELLVLEISSHKDFLTSQLHELQDVVLDMANGDQSSYAPLLEQAQRSLIEANAEREKLALQVYDLRGQLARKVC